MVLHDFYMGRSFDAYEYFGAHPCNEGVMFRVYAPNALKVELIGEFNHWDGAGDEMVPLEQSGVFELAQADAKACGEIAWSCVQHAMGFALVVNTGNKECLDARVLRSLHDDFEDNLVAASARSAQADFLVTGDDRLLAHSPVAALSPQDMVNLLEAEASVHG